MNGHVELSTKPKLATLRLLKEKGGESRCLEVASKSVRQMMMMLRGGAAPLMIESGRWRGLHAVEGEKVSGVSIRED